MKLSFVMASIALTLLHASTTAQTPSGSTAEAASYAANCTADATKSTMDILDIRLGDAWCSSTLLTKVVPGFSFYDMAPIDPRRFGPMPRSVLGHVATAIEWVNTLRNQKPYVVIHSRFGGIESLPEEMRSVNIAWALRTANFQSTPEVLIVSVTRELCVSEERSLDAGGVLRAALEQKYGVPTELITTKNRAVAEARELEEAKSYVELKAKEDPRNRQILGPSLVEKQNKVTAANRRAAEAPASIDSIGWRSSDKATLKATIGGRGQCLAGQSQVRLELDGTTFFEGVVTKALNEITDQGKQKPADASRIKL